MNNNDEREGYEDDIYDWLDDDDNVGPSGVVMWGLPALLVAATVLILIFA